METLSRKQNLTMTEPTMTLEFCPLLLLSEGNDVIICIALSCPPFLLLISRYHAANEGGGFYFYFSFLA